jgi:serine/threonine protein kinase
MKTPDYGEVLETFEYEFYSNPNSRRSSVHLLSHEIIAPSENDNVNPSGKVTQSQQLQPSEINKNRQASSQHSLAPSLKSIGAKSQLSNAYSLPDGFDYEAPTKKTPNGGKRRTQSGGIRMDSETTFGTKEELAKLASKRQIELENAPEGLLDDIKHTISKALYSPTERASLGALKPHFPWFLGTVSFIQCALLIFAMVLNYRNTGMFIEIQPFNPLIGPSPGVSKKHCCIFSRIILTRIIMIMMILRF